MTSSRREFLGALGTVAIIGSGTSLAGILISRAVAAGEAGTGRVTVLPARLGGDPVARAAEVVARQCADRRVPTVIFIPGITTQELTSQMLSVQTGVDPHRIRRGQFRPGEWKALQVAAKSLNQIPALVDDSPAPTLQQLVRKCHTLKESHSIRRVIVVSSNLSAMMTGSDGHSVPDKVVRTLDALAHELDMSVTLIL